MATSNRRQFLQTGVALSAAFLNPYVFTADAEERARPRSKNDRFRLGAIGMKYQGSVITEKALAEAVLRGYGLERYEVSSHARPGHESRHNHVYWQGEHFLNLGPSAAGFWPAENSLGVRVVNPPIKGWLAQAPPERLALTPERYVEDLLMTGLRTRAGVDLAAVSAKSGLDVAARYRELIARFGEAGLLELTGHTLRATPAGLLKLNGVLRAFFAQPSPA